MTVWVDWAWRGFPSLVCLVSAAVGVGDSWHKRVYFPSGRNITRLSRSVLVADLKRPGRLNTPPSSGP